jgi:hypothetical protein
MKQPCEGCGLEIEHGTAGCQALMDQLLARDFSDIRFFRMHRLMVDTYSLQHPDRYGASAKSLAAHLTGLCHLVEERGDRAMGSQELRRWLDGARKLEKPALPAFRGALTVADVVELQDPVAYAEATERWARTTWEAYKELHELARSWIREAHSHNRIPR